jgi:hypothetical protein
MRNFHTTGQVGYNQIGPKNGIYPIGESAFLSKFSDTDLGLSLRQLSAKETAVIRARRSIDNIEADFSEKDILDGTLLNWTLPTGALALYSQRMYWNGDTDYVLLPAMAGATSATVVITGIFLPVNGMLVANNTGTAVFAGAYTSGDNANLPTGTILVDGSSDWGTTRGHLYTALTDGQIHTVTISGFNLANFTAGIRICHYGGASNRTRGTIYNVTIDETTDGIVDHSYQGYGNTDADWLDLIGTAHGTVVGTPALFTGQTFNAFMPRWYDQKVPSTRRKMYFADEEVVTISNITLVGDFFIEQKFVIKDFSGTKGTLSDSSGALESYGFSANNTFYYFIGATTYTITLDVTLDVNKEYTLRFERNSDVISVWIDGVLQTNTVAVPSTQFKVQFIGGFRKLFGTTWDININNVARYVGGGTKTSDWLDTIGTNHGTPSATTGVGLASVSIDDWTTLSEDFIQPTAVSQPSIILDGAVNLSDGQPALLFDGVNDFIYSARRLAVNFSANDAQIALVTEVKNPTSGSVYLMAEADVVSPYSSNFIFLATVGTANFWVNVTEFGTKTSGQHALAVRKTGGAGAGTRTFETFKNGAVDEVAKDATVNNDTFIAPYRTVIGGRADGATTFFSGKLQEVIVARNTTNDIIKIQKNQMKYFAITA